MIRLFVIALILVIISQMANARDITLTLHLSGGPRLVLIATPSAPTIDCGIPPVTFVTAISAQRGNGHPIFLAISGDTEDFALSSTTVPADIVVGINGIDPLHCGMVNNITVTGTQN